jgi:hypothetical protein
MVCLYWLLVTGYWLLVTGYWLLVAGCWLLAAGYSSVNLVSIGTLPRTAIATEHISV